MSQAIAEIPMGSISSTFYLHIFVQKFVQSQTLSREKLLKRLSYEKFAHKMLMKLTKGISGNAWFEQFLATYTIYILLQTGYDLLTVCFS